MDSSFRFLHRCCESASRRAGESEKKDLLFLATPAPRLKNPRLPDSPVLRLIFLLLTLTPIACRPTMIDAPNEQTALADELAFSLKKQVLEVWYPLAVDTLHGGFLSDFSYRWEADGPQNKMIVTQARHVWTASKAAELYPEDERYLAAAAHGFAFLRDVMWDDDFGGFYALVTREGAVVEGTGNGWLLKTAYGNAFALYGLAAYYHASGDSVALKLEQDTFRWLEAHSHDGVHNGYFQFLQRDGTALTDGFGETPPKDQNSSIHLLEAFAELYHVWPDALLRKRLSELLFLIRDTITTDAGYMNLFFERDWTPVTYRDADPADREAHYHLDHVSFGHDVETAFLMMEASEALGLEDDTPTLEIGKKMVDHALRFGWDDAVGGFYDQGYYFAGDTTVTILADTKVWWAQAEALNTLLMMAHRYPNDERRYFDRFKTLWSYTKTYLLDAEHGGWYWGGLDKEPERKTSPKGQVWKGNYHTVRSLMRCVEGLRGDVEG